MPFCSLPNIEELQHTKAWDAAWSKCKTIEQALGMLHGLSPKLPYMSVADQINRLHWIGEEQTDPLDISPIDATPEDDSNLQRLKTTAREVLIKKFLAQSPSNLIPPILDFFSCSEHLKITRAPLNRLTNLLKNLHLLIDNVEPPEKEFSDAPNLRGRGDLRPVVIRCFVALGEYSYLVKYGELFAISELGQTPASNHEARQAHQALKQMAQVIPDTNCVTVRYGNHPVIIHPIAIQPECNRFTPEQRHWLRALIREHLLSPLETPIMFEAGFEKRGDVGMTVIHLHYFQDSDLPPHWKPENTNQKAQPGIPQRSWYFDTNLIGPLGETEKFYIKINYWR